MILKYLYGKNKGKVVLEKEEAFVGNTPHGDTYYFCHNHDVATHKYDCPYADIIDNTICCTATCIYNKKAEVEVAGDSYFDDVLDFDLPF